MGDRTARAFAALICAYQESAEGGLRAALPVAGRTLVERQARLAAAAGAAPIVLVVDGHAGQLASAVERLRQEGLPVEVARSAGEAARIVQADDRVLLIGDGILAEDPEADRIVEAEGYAVLTVADEVGDRFERVDSDSRWAGLAMIDGLLLKHTAPMLQDWDLQSTLLRRALQENARQVRAGSEAGLIAADSAADLGPLETSILEGAGAFQRDWVSRYLLAPIEVAATRRLMAGNVPPAYFHLGSLALLLLSAGAFASSWPWPALILFLCATPVAGIGDRLGRLGNVRGPWTERLRRAFGFAAAPAPLALAWALTPVAGWGVIVIALALILFMVALYGEAPRRSRAGIFMAEPKGLGWLMLPFAAAGLWAAGLGALAVYATASFFWAQRQAHARSGEQT